MAMAAGALTGAFFGGFFVVLFLGPGWLSICQHIEKGLWGGSVFGALLCAFVICRERYRG